jgi:hypothetical protein
MRIFLELKVDVVNSMITIKVMCKILKMIQKMNINKIT